MRTPAVGLVERIAILEATEGRYQEINTEHLLLALLKLADMPPARVSEFTRHPKAVQDIGAEIEKLRSELNNRRILITQARRSLRTKLGKGSHQAKEGEIPPRSSGAKAIFDAATKAAMEQRNPLSTLVLLECVLGEASPAVKEVLSASQGQNPPQPPDPTQSDAAIVGPHAATRPATPPPPTPAPSPPVTPAASPTPPTAPTASPASATTPPATSVPETADWHGVGTNWVAQARNGKLPELHHRPQECMALFRMLRQLEGKSVALVCETPELGKQVILALARVLARREGPADFGPLQTLLELPAGSEPELARLEAMSQAKAGLVVTLAPGSPEASGIALPPGVQKAVREGRIRALCTIDNAAHRRLTGNRAWRRALAFMWIDNAAPTEVKAMI